MHLLDSTLVGSDWRQATAIGDWRLATGDGASGVDVELELELEKRRSRRGGSWASSKAWLVSGARAKGRAGHKRSTEYSKREVAGVGFKRVSGRVIFHASATTYAYRARTKNVGGGQKERQEESEESGKGKGRGGKEVSPRPGPNELRIDKDKDGLAEVSAIKKNKKPQMQPDGDGKLVA